MNLPKLVLPKYKIKLLSSDKEYFYRPYTVKEQEILAMAKESGNINDIVQSCIDLINNCTEGIKAEDLPIFDFEYIFLKLKTISSGEILELSVPHKDPEKLKCDNFEPVEININDLKIKQDEFHTKDIKINENIGVMMKYPGFVDVSTKPNLNLFVDCIDYIYDNENIYKDSTFEEKKEWLENLDNKSFKKIQKFFETFPRVYLEIKWKCSKCGVEEIRIEEGIENFF